MKCNPWLLAAGLQKVSVNASGAKRKAIVEENVPNHRLTKIEAAVLTMLRNDFGTPERIAQMTGCTVEQVIKLRDGASAHNARAVRCVLRDGKPDNTVYTSTTQAGRMLGLSQSAVSKSATRGKIISGFKFEYVQD